MEQIFTRSISLNIQQYQGRHVREDKLHVCNNTWKTLGIGMLGMHFPQVIGSKYG
jgi:hypothetical protein